MKIAFAPFPTPFINLFFNLASYLEKAGHEVTFLSPDNYIKGLLKKNDFKVITYARCIEPLNFFNETHDLIRFYIRLFSVKNAKLLIRKKNIEYTSALRFFELNRESFDKVIFWNGAGNVESIICTKLEICCMYLENGYFPGTLQLNYLGVNCNANFAKLPYIDFIRYRFPESDVVAVDYDVRFFKQNMFSRYLKRLFDPSFNYITINILKANYLKYRAKKRFLKLPFDNIDINMLGNFIFFPLQVNSDTQIVLNSLYVSMYDVLDKILPVLLKTGCKVVMKEHPAEVEVVDYRKFIDGKNVFLIRKFSLEELICKSVFTVNVNSSVGLQAIAFKSKVLLLGESMYGHAPTVKHYESGLDIIGWVNSFSLNIDKVEEYIDHFKKNIFIEGDWRRPDQLLLLRMAQRIVANK